MTMPNELVMVRKEVKGLVYEKMVSIGYKHSLKIGGNAGRCRRKVAYVGGVRSRESCHHRRRLIEYRAQIGKHGDSGGGFLS